MSIPFCEKFLKYFEGRVAMGLSPEENIVQRIVDLCKERDIRVSQLEKDLGFGNGYLNPKKVDDIKTGRLMKILDYIQISPEEFFHIGSPEFQKASTELVRLRAINPGLYDMILNGAVDWEEIKNPALLLEDGNNGKKQELLKLFSSLSDQEVSVLSSTAKALIASRKSQGDN